MSPPFVDYVIFKQPLVGPGQSRNISAGLEVWEVPDSQLSSKALLSQTDLKTNYQRKVLEQLSGHACLLI